MMGVSWGFPKTTIGNFRFSLLKKPGGFLGVSWGFPGGFLGVSGGCNFDGPPIMYVTPEEKDIIYIISHYFQE